MNQSRRLVSLWRGRAWLGLGGAAGPGRAWAGLPGWAGPGLGTRGWAHGVDMAAGLGGVADVDIDPDGVFKYILVRLTLKGSSEHKDIVRGTKSAEYHNNIFDKLSPEMDKLGLESKCLGGGKIEHNSKEKKIRVFGISTGFGKADHSISAEKLKSKYKDYDVIWSDDTK